eukprot:9120982-Lingulodinium_polyedra.AAC.1
MPASGCGGTDALAVCQVRGHCHGRGFWQGRPQGPRAARGVPEIGRGPLPAGGEHVLRPGGNQRCACRDRAPQIEVARAQAAHEP